jgi:hypothetical protein
MSTRLLDLAALRERGIKYSVQWLGKLEKLDQFPKRVKRTPLSENTWREDEINEYLESLPQGPRLAPTHAAGQAKAVAVRQAKRQARS